ncbi:MAG TPA: pantoate--beta-alanine ligase [Ktedonosporobacter sp.]|jgi:pantoate--beta-alanine ligase|nr:pantoate--beta-alanine ligase [Ktedonosporobacter sp.]
MEVVKTVQEMVSASRRWASDDVGFVPTMGYLHEGHLSLMRRARKENSRLVASIFVNPAQFGPQEDLERYPRNLSRDLQLLENEGVDHVFVPPADQIYPPGFVTYVEPTGPLATVCEGAHRPGHFRGVATVVLKLFELVRPQRAYFGQKDAQQVAVITRMVADLNLPVQLIIMPTVRETDGLAMSSRNSYLDPPTRATATVLYRALQAGRQVFDAHLQGDPQLVEQAMIDVIDAEPGIALDYAQVRDPGSFMPLATLQAPALLVIAAHIGQVRLIDNFLLRTDGSWDTGIAVPER